MHLDGNSAVVALDHPDGEVACPTETAKMAGSTAPCFARTATRSVPPALGTPFAQIYDEHFDLVLRALGRYGVPKPQLEDALQEVFVIVHNRASTFEGRSSLHTWIYGIARRVARDHRSSTRQAPVDPFELDELAAREDEADPRLEQLDAARLLYSLLAQLTPERQEILVLVELEQMTVAEAAEILEENPNTLQSRLKQAREDLSRAHQRQTAEQAWRQKCATKTQP